MKKELVSVIINSHNGAKYIKKSVKSVLKQSYDNIEVIFWDNASDDKTKEIITDCNFDNRFKYITQKTLINFIMLNKKQLN